MRGWWSGQSQQTVNLSTSVFAGSNPAPRTNKNKSPKYLGDLFLLVEQDLNRGANF